MKKNFPEKKKNPSKPSPGGKEQVGGAEKKSDSSHPQPRNGLGK